MTFGLNIEEEQEKAKKFFENFLVTSAGEVRRKYLEILQAIPLRKSETLFIHFDDLKEVSIQITVEFSLNISCHSFL